MCRLRIAAAASKGRPAKRGRIILCGKAADALPDQRMADLMYEEFRRGEYELSEKPIKGIENWSWGRGKVLGPQELWAGYAYGFHSAAASCFEPQGLYGKAAVASARDGTVYSDWHGSRIPANGEMLTPAAAGSFAG